MQVKTILDQLNKVSLEESTPNLSNPQQVAAVVPVVLEPIVETLVINLAVMVELVRQLSVETLESPTLMEKHTQHNQEDGLLVVEQVVVEPQQHLKEVLAVVEVLDRLVVLTLEAAVLVEMEVFKQEKEKLVDLVSVLFAIKFNKHSKIR